MTIFVLKGSLMNEFLDRYLALAALVRQECKTDSDRRSLTTLRRKAQIRLGASVNAMQTA
jgi:hypothetical protein